MGEKQCVSKTHKKGTEVVKAELFHLGKQVVLMEETATGRVKTQEIQNFADTQQEENAVQRISSAAAAKCLGEELRWDFLKLMKRPLWGENMQPPQTEVF